MKSIPHQPIITQNTQGPDSTHTSLNSIHPNNPNDNPNQPLFSNQNILLSQTQPNALASNQSPPLSYTQANLPTFYTNTNQSNPTPHYANNVLKPYDHFDSSLANGVMGVSIKVSFPNEKYDKIEKISAKKYISNTTDCTYEHTQVSSPAQRPSFPQDFRMITTQNPLFPVITNHRLSEQIEQNQINQINGIHVINGISPGQNPSQDVESEVMKPKGMTNRVGIASETHFVYAEDETQENAPKQRKRSEGAMYAYKLRKRSNHTVLLEPNSNIDLPPNHGHNYDEEDEIFEKLVDDEDDFGEIAEEEEENKPKKTTMSKFSEVPLQNEPAENLKNPLKESENLEKERNSPQASKEEEEKICMKNLAEGDKIEEKTNKIKEAEEVNCDITCKDKISRNQMHQEHITSPTLFPKKSSNIADGSKSHHASQSSLPISPSKTPNKKLKNDSSQKSILFTKTLGMSPSRKKLKEKHTTKCKKRNYFTNISPLNLEQQEKEFFLNQCKKNPVFEYDHYKMAEKIMHTFKKPSGDYLKLAVKILQDFIQHYGSESNYLKLEGGEILSVVETEQIFMDYISDLGLENHISIRFSENTVIFYFKFIFYRFRPLLFRMIIGQGRALLQLEFQLSIGNIESWEL